MSLIQTNTGRKIFKKAESMLVVPYVYNSGIDDYALGETVYDISAVIGDSIVLEQSEGTTEIKENEFRSEPLLQVTSGAKYGFTAQCLDLQNNVLRALFKAMTVGDHDIAAFNDDYTTLYALVRIGFGGQDTPDIILPKVQLNSRIFIQQLRTRAGQGNISGTANSFNIAIKDPDNPRSSAPICGACDKWDDIYSIHACSLYAKGLYASFQIQILGRQNGRIQAA